MTAENPSSAVQQTFRMALNRFRTDAPALILGHNDADGLSAMALLARALRRSGRPLQTRIVGRGENPWSEAIRTELSHAPAGGLIVADLGVREGEILQNVETVVIDHHVPAGSPGSATVISGFPMDPVPTSSLLAYWCAAAIAEIDDLLWIAALGIIGDMAEKSGFQEMEGHGVSINPCILRPEARGKVSLRSPKAEDPILFVGNNLTTKADIDTLMRGIKLGRKILAAPAMKAMGLRELAPGDKAHDDAAIEHYARSIAKTVYHPSGTCKMGRDPMAVVDSQLRVIGVPRLRVADASIMPTLVSGNTNAPSIMIAERCADFVLSKAQPALRRSA